MSKNGFFPFLNLKKLNLKMSLLVAIAWHYKSNLFINGFGNQMFTLKEATEWITYLNERFPEIYHFTITNVP